MAFYATAKHDFNKKDWERYVKAEPNKRKDIIDLTLLKNTSLQDNFLTLMNAQANTDKNAEWGDFKGVIFEVGLVQNSELSHFIKDDDLSTARVTNYTTTHNISSDSNSSKTYHINKELLLTQLQDKALYYGGEIRQIESKNQFNLDKLADYKVDNIQQNFINNPLDFNKINQTELSLEHKPAGDGFYYLGNDKLSSFMMMNVSQIRDVYQSNGEKSANHIGSSPNNTIHQTNHIDEDIAIDRPINSIAYDFHIYKKVFNIGDDYFDIFPFTNADLKDFKQVFNL